MRMWALVCRQNRPAVGWGMFEFNTNRGALMSYSDRSAHSSQIEKETLVKHTPVTKLAISLSLSLSLSLSTQAPKIKIMDKCCDCGKQMDQ